MQCNISIWDNGPGFANNNKKDSLGLKLVKMLVEEMDGEIEFDFREGTRADLSFPMKAYRVKSGFNLEQN